MKSAAYGPLLKADEYLGRNALAPTNRVFALAERRMFVLRGDLKTASVRQPRKFIRDSRMSGGPPVQSMSISSPEGRLSDAKPQCAFDHPRFEADTFWNFKRTSEVFGAKYPAPPLGLITLAALLPRVWSIRLVNRNTEELTDEDLDWADLVLTGGMLPQGGDMLDVVDLCHARGKPVVVGGPGVTSSPHLYQTADFQILGEAEGVIDKFLEAWEAGAREGSSKRRNFRSMSPRRRSRASIS